MLGDNLRHKDAQRPRQEALTAPADVPVFGRFS